MIKKNCIKLLCFWGILGLSLVQGVAQVSQMPNILLLHADDMSWRDCEPYGNPDVITPNITRLAEQGMTFNNMHTSTAMCAPTRMQLYTGIYPVRNGAYPNHSAVYDGTKSLVHHFEKLDYRVALIGKVHHEPFRSFPFEFLGGRHHDNGKGQDIDLERIKPILNQAKPFFLVVSSNQPHSPWNRGDASQYDKKKISVPEYMVDCEKTRNDLVNYYAEITYTDSLLGVCMNYLEEAGKEDNTIVIFTSEQGSSFPFAKWTCYDLGLKTAFVIKWPEMIKAGTNNSALAQYVDIVPTLLDAVGGNLFDVSSAGVSEIKSKSGFDGESFLDILLQKKHKHRNYVYGIHTTRGIYSGSVCYPIRSVRNQRYKYILNLNSSSVFHNMVTTRKDGIYESWLDETNGDGKKQSYVAKYHKRPKEELYDILSDPYELTNLADSTILNKVKFELRRELFKWMKQQGDEGINTELKAYEHQPLKKKPGMPGYEDAANRRLLEEMN
ncbi:MAG: sulfatase [Carboxylicivirga sp.]|nr:sulfatase [Carboxylicivirga sp.]